MVPHKSDAGHQMQPDFPVSCLDGGQTCVTLNLVIHLYYTHEKG